jgi:carbamoyltransferase
MRKILGLWDLEKLRALPELEPIKNRLKEASKDFSILAIHGSHNAAVSLAINDEIKEVIEIERLVGKKNAALYSYDATIVKNKELIFNWILNRFRTKYNIREFDLCFYDAVNLDEIQRYFPSKEYCRAYHHVSHAYGSLYQSPHNEALILSFDGGGSDGWFILYRGKKREYLETLKVLEVNYGVCYGMIGHYLKSIRHENTYDIGNLVYAGKLMGLAGYGKVREQWIEGLKEWYSLGPHVDHISQIKAMFNKLNIVLDENDLVSEEDSKDLAATSQFVFEQNILEFLKPYMELFAHLPLHITGGGALNILLNTILVNMGKEVFISPNPNDCGLTVGMLCSRIIPEQPVDVTYSGLEILDPDALMNYTADEEIYYGIDELTNDLACGSIIGVVMGKSEHGPRALGHRSVLCNPSINGMKDILNKKVKNREWYRPFAPVVRLEDVNEYFEWDKPSRWMSYCPKVKPEYREKLESITHTDGTARIQTVTHSENPWLYNLLTEFKKKTGIGVLLNTSFNVSGKPILNTYKEAFQVYNNTEMDGLFLEDMYIKKPKNKNKEKTEIVVNNADIKPQKQNLTVVTGLWNIGRSNRPFDTYIEQFKNVLDIDCNLFVLIPKEYEYIVWEKRKKENTFVRVFELQDIKDLYGDFWDKTQKIRENPLWYNQAGWLTDSPQAKLEWYNPIVMSKYSLLHNVTVWNPFNTDYFLWLDGGITFSVYEKYFTEYRILDKIIPYLETFLFLSYPYEATNEIHGFTYTELNKYTKEPVKYVCRGGLFGGHKDIIHEGNSTYWHLLHDTLSKGLMGTEESIFSIMAYREPHIYRRYSLDENGLIVKFADALANDKVVLEPIPKTKKNVNIPITDYNLEKIKTNLYILTFNFPEQLLYLLSSMEKVPEWLAKPHLILIDNSASKEAIDDNEAIAKKYNMEHIKMEYNTGICGGRQKAAEHFHESDADFMVFFEDDMTINSSELSGEFCRNGFRKYVPGLYDIAHKIIMRENFDFLKLSFTEVYFDNDKSLPWYNVPQDVRTRDWPDYDKLPVSGLDPNSPLANYKHIKIYNGVAYLVGDVNYCNWPIIVSKDGNRKIFIDTKWAHPYEQTWSSHVYNLIKAGEVTAGVLMASPIWHERIKHYSPEERREN